MTNINVICFESTKNGNLTLYVEINDETVEVVIPKGDIKRLINASIDALNGDEKRY